MSDSIYQKHKPTGSNDLYLRLKDGDAVKMRIYSDPVIVVFKQGQRPRYAWTVINHTDKKVQVFNGGVSIYNQIADLTEEWGDPKEFDITIKRKGSGQFDTEYSVTPAKTPTAPTKDQEEEADKIDLIASTKGKWLEEYAKDGVLPDPISNEELDEVHPVDDTIDPSDIPF
jgi:hypothetical protein